MHSKLTFIATCTLVVALFIGAWTFIAHSTAPTTVDVADSTPVNMLNVAVLDTDTEPIIVAKDFDIHFALLVYPGLEACLDGHVTATLTTNLELLANWTRDFVIGNGLGVAGPVPDMSISFDDGFTEVSFTESCTMPGPKCSPVREFARFSQFVNFADPIDEDSAMTTSAAWIATKTNPVNHILCDGCGVYHIFPDPALKVLEPVSYMSWGVRDHTGQSFHSLPYGYGRYTIGDRHTGRSTNAMNGGSSSNKNGGSANNKHVMHNPADDAVFIDPAAFCYITKDQHTYFRIVLSATENGHHLIFPNQESLQLDP